MSTRSGRGRIFIVRGGRERTAHRRIRCPGGTGGRPRSATALPTIALTGCGSLHPMRWASNDPTPSSTTGSTAPAPRSASPAPRSARAGAVRPSDGHPRRAGAPVWPLFLILSATWGSSYLFIKIGVEAGLPPLSLVTWRLLFGVATLVVIARLTGARLPRRPGTIAKLGLLGIMNVAIPFSLITWGELSIPSASAAILNGTQPLFTAVIAAFALADERLTRGRAVGLVLGFAGALLILSPSLEAAAAGRPAAGPAPPLVGELAVVLATLGYSASSVFVRRSLSGHDEVDDPVRGPRPLGPVEIALPQLASALAVIATLAFFAEWLPTGRVIVPPTPSAWFAVAWLGVLGSGLAYLMFFTLIRAWGATKTSLVTYVMPAVGIFLGVLVLAESVDVRAVIGTALVVGGIGFVHGRLLPARRVGPKAPPGGRPIRPGPAAGG
jgi:drug/metabolite transporter (DMT)-like permease